MSPVVLIGPAGAGKSTVGQLVATLSGRSFVDIDGVGDRFYERAGQPVDPTRRSDRIARVRSSTSLVAAGPASGSRRDRRVPTSVIPFGAGHSHFEDDGYAQQAAPDFARVFVVLLLPSADSPESLRPLL